MSKIDLDDTEREWLVTLSRGPLTKLAVDEAMPAAVRESLLLKDLIRWRSAGPFEVTLLEVTPYGEEHSERLQRTH